MEQKQKAEIASEEVHSQNNIVFPAFLLAAKGLLLPPIGLKASFQVLRENKAFAWLTRLEE